MRLPLGNPSTRHGRLLWFEEPDRVFYQKRKYGGPDCLDIDEPDAMTSSAQPVITIQLREPLTIQTYLARVVMTTLIARKPEYDTKALSHPILSVNSILVTDELDGATFHTLEIMQVVRVNEEVEPDNT
ncbi:hypothetical protein H5410_060589 [Solanum commersonii]|uniref:Uncharacterized protein n=1 Tax=Solanum commersonii TaxID=4109 RepID=A0A9J5W630_SOLCO|nr:hypothetical protein H5410_060589 [Solanum commersonii]